MSTNETYGVMGFVDEHGNQNIHYPISQAELITYNNASSGLKAGDTQAALDELSAALDAAKPLSGTSDPTSATKGAVGQHYTNTTTGKEFTCLAADDEHGVYTWEASGGGGGGSLVLNAIRIKTAPTKTAYKAGETFDPTGMEIVADYAMDGVVILKDQEVDDYSYPTGALAAGTAKVTISLTKNGVTKTVDQAITCTKTAVTVPAVSGTYTYNGNTQTFSFTNEPNSSIATKSGDTSGLNAGSYTTRFTLNSPDLYQWADGSTSSYKDIPVTIGVVTPTVTAPTKAANMTYNGSSRDLTATAGSTNFGTLQYSTDGTNWSTTRPKATNAGSYTVRYRVVGDSNINSVASTSIGTVTIAVKEPTLTVSPSSITLDADHLTGTSTITCDGDGTISVESSNTGVATATLSGNTVTIQHVDETSGSATITVKHTAKSGGNYATKTTTIAVTASFISEFADASWEQVATVGAAGKGAQYWDIGDMHDVTLNGTVGITSYSNKTMKLFIAHFNYKGQNGIYLMGFKDSASGKVLGLCDTNYNSTKSDGTKTYNMNHWGGSSSPYNTNYGGWAGCDLRYDILGSTNKQPSGYGSTATTSRVGYDPDNYDIVNSPVSNTLMAALPSALRQNMKSFTVYTDNKGNSSTAAANVTASVDYIVLPAEYEVFGTTVSYANENEPAQQEQLKYYELGNSKITYKDTDPATAVNRWERSPYRTNADDFALVDTDGSSYANSSRLSSALTPLLRVA